MTSWDNQKVNDDDDYDDGDEGDDDNNADNDDDNVVPKDWHLPLKMFLNTIGGFSGDKILILMRIIVSLSGLCFLACVCFLWYAL